MAGQLTTKIRFVRCPGCLGILQELAPVYQCAGCGKVLQAKKRINDTTETGSPRHETDTAQKNEIKHVSGDEEARSSSPEETQPCAGELPSDKNLVGDQREVQDSNGEIFGGKKFLSELSAELTSHVNEESSPAVRAETEVDNNGGDQSEYVFQKLSAELTSHVNEESSPVVRAETEVDQDECSTDKNNGGDQSEYVYCNGKQPEGISFSDEDPKSNKPSHDEREESSPLVGAHSEEDLEQNSGRNQNDSRYCNGKQLGGIDVSNGIASSSELYHHDREESSLLAGAQSDEDEKRNCSEQNSGRNRTEFGDHKREWLENMDYTNEVASSTELLCQEIEESSPVVGANAELDDNVKSRFIFGSLSLESRRAASPRNSIISGQKPLGESNLTDIQITSHGEQLDQSQKRGLHGFDRVSSEETLEDFALPKPSLEFSVKDMPKSPTTRSYYAYDGSVSSYDGTDDQVPDLPLHLLKGKFKEAEYASAKVMSIRDEDELQYQAWNCSSTSSDPKHYAMKGGKWCEDELLESTRHGHTVRSRMKIERDESLSEVPFYARGYDIGSENGSPSKYRRNDFQHSIGFDSPNKPQYRAEEKMELLKMVYELQGQLSRSHILTEKAKGRFSGLPRPEKQIPSYYDHVAPEVDPRYDLNNSGYPRRCNQGTSWPHQSQISRIPFSAESKISRHQVDHSCFHGCCEDWHCTAAPLPQQIFCNKGQYTAHPRQKYCNLYPSGQSSPRHYTGSEFSLLSCDVKSDEHWHTNHHEQKQFSRDRPHLVKKHVLPISGAAPFLVCYGCSAVLQLPADFLLLGRRCHRLRCSACSVILKFTLQNGTHILPCKGLTADSIAPLPSKVDYYSDSQNGRKLASVSHANYSPHVDPVSYSDDYGPSLRQSFSTEEEPSPITHPFHTRNKVSNDRKISSASSFEPMEEREKQPVFEESQNMYKNHVQTFASAESTSERSKPEKLSTQTEELPPKSGSALHRLLGYSSASDILYSW